MPSRSRANHSTPIIISPADEKILKSLWRYYYLTSQQICRLHYAPSSITLVQSKLKLLYEWGFCQRLWMPKRIPRGSAPAVYTLARKGLNHLKVHGVVDMRRYHPSEQGTLSYLFLTHTLELNDFLISAELLGRWAPEFQLAALIHERELKRHPVYVSDGKGGKTAVFPDAWLDIRLEGSFQVCLAVELDRGTEEQKKFRQKVANLLAYADGPYQETFETRSLTFAVLTTAGEQRLWDLLDWTRAELEERGEQSQADLFLFANAGPSDMDADRIFLSPVWYQPFKPEPIALLAAPSWV